MFKLCQLIPSPVVSWLLFASAALVSQSGCLTLRSKGPVDQDVLVARQLSRDGISAMHRGQWEEAEARFAEALRHSPEDIPTRCRLADCLWRRGASGDAIQELSRALEISADDDPATMVRLGKMYLSVGNMKAATRMVNEAFLIDPSEPRAWQLNGDLLKAKGNLRQSLISYQRASTLDPKNVQLHLSIAECYHTLDRPRRTLVTVNHIMSQLEQKQQPPRLAHLKGLALRKLERYDDAIEALLLARAMGASDRISFDLADTQFAAGQYSAAQQTVSEGLRSASPGVASQLRQLSERIAIGNDGLFR